MADKAILYDSSKCTACRGCMVACKQWWGLEGEKTRNLGSYENPPDLSYNTWLKIRFNEIESNKPAGVEWIFTRQACMHCTDAACVKVCPSGALYYGTMGNVAYNPDICTGCGYCSEFCPFKVPKLQGGPATVIRKMNKCILCFDRISNNQEPACVKTCPTDALIFGDRQELVNIGKNRVQELKSAYPEAYLYGEKELGGLHVMYVLTHSPQVHGLPVNPEVPVAAIAWKDVLKPAGYALTGLAVVGLGLNYLVARANANAKAEIKAESKK
ncbi:MAG: 4Fe-4S dicluster domain-containing protein [Dehalococcoidia bacterium]|nr:4Fe-4S dicluster domain-containing protein [Dehalococcoidia bacterium]